MPVTLPDVPGEMHYGKFSTSSKMLYGICLKGEWAVPATVKTMAMPELLVSQLDKVLEMI